MRRALPLLLLLAPSMAAAYCPPDAVCVDPTSIRANVGLSQLTLDGGDGPARVGYGVTLGYGTGLASALIGRHEGLAGHDELWVDLTLGGRASEPLYYYDLKEGFFAISMDTGYVLMLGWNTKTWGLFGGTGVRYTTSIVGGSMDFEGSRAYAPLMVRAQVRTGTRLWKAYGWTNTRLTRPGLRLDVPLAETVWLSGAWMHTAQAVSLFSDDNGAFSGHGGSVATISVRTSFME